MGLLIIMFNCEGGPTPLFLLSSVEDKKWYISVNKGAIFKMFYWSLVMLIEFQFNFYILYLQTFQVCQSGVFFWGY